MAVAATHSTTHHQTYIPLTNRHGVRIMATATKILSPHHLLAGSHLHQAQVALPAGLPHHPLGRMDPMAESMCNRRRATHKTPVMAMARSLGVGPRGTVSLTIVDDQGTRTEEEMETHTEDSEIHTAGNIEAVEKPDVDMDEKVLAKMRVLLGGGNHHVTVCTHLVEYSDRKRKKCKKFERCLNVARAAPRFDVGDFHTGPGMMNYSLELTLEPYGVGCLEAQLS